MTPSANDLYRAARRFAAQGQPVFPCKAVGEKAKAPLIKYGLNAASVEPEQIKAWWRKWRDAAIGIPTGIIWDVLDVDVKHGSDGRVHLPMLNSLGLLDGCQLVVRTPSGGWHLYFHAHPGITNKASAHLGLDVRGKGGYVLAPPSYLTGAETALGDTYSGAYEVIGEPANPSNQPLYWAQILNCIAPINEDTKKPIELLPSERRSSLAALREWLSNRSHGERNNALYWAICRCIESNIDPHELVEAATLTGLGEEEILLSVEQAMIRAGLTVHDLDDEAEVMFPDES